MKFTSNLSLLLIVSTLFIVSCGDDPKPAVAVQKTATKTNPFPFYKLIEIRPGINFEILSWGKGVDSLGGYSILMSDSLRNNYKSLTAERKGVFKDAWNLDLDTDGNPEFYIEILKNKNEADLMVYEFDDNEFKKISFPSLSSRIRKVFLGNDKFFIKNGELFRSIPVKDDEDPSGKKTIVQTVKYLLQGNSFDIKEVKE